MKLKKILAVALAATTALTMVPANVVEAAKVPAAPAGTAASSGDSFTFTLDNFGTTDKTTSGAYAAVTFTAEVTDVAGSNSKDYNAANGFQYQEGTNQVKIVKAVAKNSDETLKTFDLPVGVWLDDEDYGTEGTRYYDRAGAQIAYFDVTGVDLTADEDYDSSNQITGIDMSWATGYKTIKLENFDADNFTLTMDVPGSYNKLETVDLSGTRVEIGDSTAPAQDTVMGLIDGSEDTLETLDLKELAYPDKYSKVDKVLLADNINATTGGFIKLKNVNLSGNAYVEEVSYAPNTYTIGNEVVLNISDMNKLKKLGVMDKGYKDADKLNDDLKKSAYFGVKFITDGSEEGKYELDLSGYNMNEVIVNYTKIEAFKAPSPASKSDGSSDDIAQIDIQNNFITDLDLSSSSGYLKKLLANNNRLLDIDLSGQDKLETCEIKENFLTSINGSDLKLGSVNVDHNYIPKKNMDKGDRSISFSGEQGADIYFTVTGDGGLAAPDSDSKAYVKLGGNANIIAGTAAGADKGGAPAGFAEKLAATIDWEEANQNGGSIATLGTPVVMLTQDIYEVKILGYGSAVLAAVPVTAAAEKMAAEKLTVNIGGKTKSINVAADDVAVVTYDVTTNLKDAAKSKFDKQIMAVMFDYPQTAGVYTNGEAKITTPESPANTTKGLGLAAAKKFHLSSDIGTEKNLGYKFTDFNDAAEGTGTSYKANKSIKFTADTTLYATYKETTYNITFGKGGGTGTTDQMKGINYNDEAALSSNGYTLKDNSFEGWYKDTPVANNTKIYTNGESVNQLSTSNVTMNPLWSKNDVYVYPDKNSLELVLGDVDKSSLSLKGELDPYTTDDNGKKWDEGSVDNSLEYKGSGVYKPDYKYLTGNDGVVGIVGNNTLVAKGTGTATVYIFDDATTNSNKAVATVTVNVISETEATKKANEIAAQKKLDEGKEAVDVSEYSKIVAKAQKNADGENTVTVTEGQNIKTVNLAKKIVINGKEYTITRIAANAYKGMSKVQSVSTGNNVKVIGKAAFANCKKLAKVTLGTKVAKIGANAFKGDKKLAKIMVKSKKLTTKAKVGKNSFKGIKATAKFYIAKKAATYKKVKKAFKAQSGAPKKAKFVKKYA